MLVGSLGAFLSFFVLEFVGLFSLCKDAFFKIISFFFSNCPWLTWDSAFSSSFGSHARCACFYLGSDEVFIFVIQSMSFRYFLKSIKCCFFYNSDLTDKMKQFLLNSGRIDNAIWMHYLDANKTAGEEAIRQLHKNAARQHPTKHQLYGHRTPITKTIQVRRTRHAGHCWRSMDELIRDVPLWPPTYGRAKAGRQARTYIQQLCENTGCSPEDLPEAMNDWEKWRERVRDIREEELIVT